MGSWHRLLAWSRASTEARAQDEVAWEETDPVRGVEGASRRRVSVYRGLAGDDFRHPLDQQNTTMLRGLPGLEMIAKNLMGPVAEQVLLLAQARLGAWA